MSLDEFPKILIVSDAAWADNNNIGNTFSNLFSFWPKDRIAMVYARPNLPSTRVCEKFFQISETRIIKNIYDKSVKTGMEIDLLSTEELCNQKSIVINDEKNGKKLYNFFLKYRYSIFLIAREILWGIGRWKSKELDKFIIDYNPDIVLSLANSSIYMNSIQQYIINISNAKSAIYFVDDVYSNKRLNFSPLYWLNRMLIRNTVRKTVSMSHLIYTIIDKQQEEYNRYFNVQSKILNKGGLFNNKVENTKINNSPIKLVYTGNITSGRWKTLAKIGGVLDEINKSVEKAKLEIYTQNFLYSKIDREFKKHKSIVFMGGIPANEVKEVQNSADILVHVESLNMKEMLETRLSFSTKIVDYFERGKCIVAIGDKESASINYLKNNKAAVVIENIDLLKGQLDRLIASPGLIDAYGKHAYSFGRANHNIKKIQKMLMLDFQKLVKDHDLE